MTLGMPSFVADPALRSQGARRAPRVAVAVCLGGSALLGAAAALPGSSLQATPGAGRPILIAVAAAGVVAALVGFLLVLRAAWAGRLSLRTALWLAVAAHVTVLFLPLLYSRDVYSYTLYGRMLAIHHLNPYVARPVDVGTDPFFALAGSGWTHTTSVYGPAFTWISAALARAIRSGTGAVLAYRVLAEIASMATVLLVARSARALRPERAAFAVAVLGVNPAVVFLVVASGHNDALVALSIAAAFAAVVAKRPLLATAALTAGLLVKAPPAVPLLILVVADVAALDPGRRLRRFGAHAGVVCLMAVAASFAFLQRQDPTLGQRQLANHAGGIAPLNWVRAFLHAVGERSGAATGAATDTLVRIVSFGCLVAVIGAIVWVTARRARAGELGVMGLGAAWAWGLLSFQLLVLAFLPWYLVWVLPLAWLLPPAARRLVVQIGVLQVCSLLVVDPGVYPLAEVRDVLIAVSVLAPIVLFLSVRPARELVSRLRRGIPLELEASPAGGRGDASAATLSRRATRDVERELGATAAAAAPGAAGPPPA